MVERVLCKHEVVGSIPSGSTIVARSGKSEFLVRPRLGEFDIVNEGSVRLRRSAKIFNVEFEDGPEKTS